MPDVYGPVNRQLLGSLVVDQPRITCQQPVVIEDDLSVGRVAACRNALPGSPVPDEQVVEIGIEHHHAVVSGSEDGGETACGGVAGNGKAVAGRSRRSYGRVINRRLCAHIKFGLQKSVRGN